MAVLSPEEQSKAAKFYFLRDAKLSVASSLLKRLFVAKNAGVSWKDVVFTRRGDPKHGKPCYVPARQDSPTLDFNVSHQAGIATLIGCRTPGIEVGIDLTCVNEREKSDLQTIKDEGFDYWVDMHAEVFSDADLQNMKRAQQTINGKSMPMETSSQLRTFYTYWCLKEAYVKLVGEGLLAKWLTEVEFRNVEIPKAPVCEIGDTTHMWGERITTVEVWVKGQKQHDVSMTLQAFEDHYIFGTAYRQRSSLQGDDTAFEILDLEVDVLPYTG